MNKNLQLSFLNFLSAHGLICLQIILTRMPVSHELPIMVKNAVSGLAADMVINSQMNGSQMAMAGGGSVSSTDLTSLVGAIREAVGGVFGNSGNIVIPVYIGGTMLDEVIVNAQQRANLRSVGR